MPSVRQTASYSMPSLRSSHLQALDFVSEGMPAPKDPVSVRIMGVREGKAFTVNAETTHSVQ